MQNKIIYSLLQINALAIILYLLTIFYLIYYL